MMKLIVSILTGIMLSLSNSVTEKHQKITISVINVTSDEGKIGFALYDKTTFMKQPIRAKNAKIENGISSVTFENIENGEYAVICFHDKNSNNRMDFSENGMPIEDYGATNNVLNMGPPQFEDAKFDVANNDVTLEIKF